MWIGVLILAGIMSLTPVSLLAQEQDVNQPSTEHQQYLNERIKALEATLGQVQAQATVEEEEEEVEVENPHRNRIEEQLMFEEQYNIDDGDSD